jgi:LuxR family maltose regulon positive regulatory protein
VAYQILATKLYSPPRQAHFVARSTLLERLDRGLQQGKRLTLVSAPAGFGKSTLVSQWLSARMKEEGGRMKSPDSSFIPHPSSLAFGWLSLDAGDNDPTRFLVYLVAALQQAAPSLGQAVLAALQSPQVPPLPELLEALINELAVAAGSLLLVLDDYHLVKSRDVHDLTQLLLER